MALFYFVPTIYLVMKTVYIRNDHAKVLNEYINKRPGKTILLTEESGAVRKAVKEIIARCFPTQMKTYLDMSLNDPFMVQNIKPQVCHGGTEPQIWNSVANHPTQNKFIDFLRANLYSQLNINRDRGPIEYIKGAARIMCNELGFYSWSEEELRGGDIIKFGKLLNAIHDNKNFFLGGEPDMNCDMDGMSYGEFMGRFAPKYNQWREDMRAAMDAENYEGEEMPRYRVVPIKDEFTGTGCMPVGDSLKYLLSLGEYCDWCICIEDKIGQMYPQYTGGGGKVYVLERDGYRDIKPIEGENCPLDEYGLSLICVIVGPDGMPDNITTRWNHNNGGENPEGLRTAIDIQRVTHLRYNEVFKPRSDEELEQMHMLSESDTPSAMDQVHNKVNAGVMDAVTGGGMMEEAGGQRLEKWYRGYKARYGSQRTHLLWVTNDIGYARMYGNRVEEFVIDMNKLNAADGYEIDNVLGYEFDTYDDMSEEDVAKMSAAGFGGYEYLVSEDEGYDCLCFWDQSAVVSRRELSKDEFDGIERYYDDIPNYDDDLSEGAEPESDEYTIAGEGGNNEYFHVNECKKSMVITEEQWKHLQLIIENEGTNLKKARNLLKKKGYGETQRQEILNSIRNDIPNARLQQCKFMLGVTRMYLDGELRDPSTVSKLNKALEYIASDAHVNEYDYDLNGESPDTLIERFSEIAKTDLETAKAASDSRQLTPNEDYTIVPIDTPKSAARYGKYTSWCVTHSADMYNSYTKNGIGRFYFCLRNDFKTAVKTRGENCPLDDYGLSMIAVSVDEVGNANTITCRWNHDYDGNDSVMTVEQLETLLGRNFYQTFKPYTREELHAKGIILTDEIQDMLDAGRKPSDLFKEVRKTNVDGISMVVLRDEYNYLKNNKLMSKKWFVEAPGYTEFVFGVIPVKLSNFPSKMNGMTVDGEFIFKENPRLFFGYNPNQGVAMVVKDDDRRENFIDKNRELIFKNWYSFVSPALCKDGETLLYSVAVDSGVPGIRKGFMYINRYEEPLNGKIYGETGSFHDGIARVEDDNGGVNYIDTSGKLISEQWFYNGERFIDGIAVVYLNPRNGGPNTNYLLPNGQLLSKKNFAFCETFHNGFGVVYKIDSNRGRVGNYIDKEGKFLSKVWFERINSFGYPDPGYGRAFIGNRCFYVSKDGNMEELVHGEMVPVKVVHGQVVRPDKESSRFNPYSSLIMAESRIGNIDFKKYFKPIAEFMHKDGLNVKPYPKVKLDWSPQDGLFIKTGYYEPESKTITIFCDDRHPKDILRTYCHEMIHHSQNLDGVDLNFSSKDDVKDNEKLEEIESEAYLKGNVYFRKWTEYQNKNSKDVLQEGKALRKNDKGETVPEKCDKCGGDVVCQIHGEPVFVCKDCGKYFGTMPCNLNESNMDEYWNGEGEEMNFEYPEAKTIPNKLYHVSPIKNRESILKVGLVPSVGDEYYDWWSYSGPNGEYDDPSDIPQLIFLSSKPTMWSDRVGYGGYDLYEIDTDKLDKEDITLDPTKHIAKEGGYCYGQVIPPSALKLVKTYNDDTGENDIIYESTDPDDIDLSSFNIKTALNPKFWKDEHLDSRIRMKLLDIADDFIDFLGVDWVKPDDVIMTGSLANYNWNKKYSDIDLHILIDYSKVDKRRDFVDNYFYSQKKLWNDEHKDLKIFGFPVELYVQDSKEKHASTGVYSLDKDKWIVEPERDKLKNSKVNKTLIKNKVADYIDKIEEILTIYKKANDNFHIEEAGKKAKELFEKIKGERKGGLNAKNNEMSNGNIIFKCLRRLGYIEKLTNLIGETYDKINSLS